MNIYHRVAQSPQVVRNSECQVLPPNGSRKYFRFSEPFGTSGLRVKDCGPVFVGAQGKKGAREEKQ